MAAVAVVGVPDDHWGEAVCAIVTGRPASVIGADALVAHCRDRLAGYKRPRHVLFRADLPVNANGKIDKPAVAALGHRTAHEPRAGSARAHDPLTTGLTTG